MRKLHYKGLFDLKGKLKSSIYNPHKFDVGTIQIAYQRLTQIQEHKSPKILTIAKGDFANEGYVTIKLTKNSNFRVGITASPRFWIVCEQFAMENPEFKRLSKQHNTTTEVIP